MAVYRTKTELAVDHLRERILRGELAPGERIRPNQLAARLTMSPTPVREALRLLQADGLVSYRSHQEIVVAEHSPAEAAEVYRLRLVLEPLATELGAAQLTSTQLNALERLDERLRAAVDAGRRLQTATINAAWHWEIYDASTSPVLLSFVRRLWDAFPWRTMWALPGRVEASAGEHGAIMDALRSRDRRRAAALMATHIESGRTSVLARLEAEHSEAA